MKLSEAFPSNYLKASDLNGKDVVLTIKGAEIESLGSPSNPDRKLVLRLNGTEKGFVLNKTNATTISGLYGDDTDNWIGKKIIVGAREVEFQGKMVMSLRVSLKKPEGGAPAKPAVQAADDWDTPEEAPF